MKPYSEMTINELEQELKMIRKHYRHFQDLDLHLDMSRGKPCTEQLDLSMEMLDELNGEGTDRGHDGKSS